MAPGTSLAQLPDILSVEEVAVFLRISRGLVYEAVRTGDIPCVRVGSRKLIMKTALLQFLCGETARGLPDCNE